MKPAYTRMVSVCFIISLLTTAYPVSTTFLNLQKLSGPAYTDAAFSLSITNSEAFAASFPNSPHALPRRRVINTPPHFE